MAPEFPASPAARLAKHDSPGKTRKADDLSCGIQGVCVMAFGSEYSDDHVHFIAGGRTRALIEKYIWEKENADKVLEGIAKEYGGIAATGGAGEGASMLFAAPTDNPLFTGGEPDSYKGQKAYYYKVNTALPEGKALAGRINDVPKWELGFNRFAKRLTGAETVNANPDDLRDFGGGEGRMYGSEYGTLSAYYRKYGDTYVVSVPRVLRGVFNEASEKLSQENRVKMSAGYTYEWFTPPDSTQIPYSKVIELREQELGDQLKPQVASKPVASIPRRR
jgi:hypothetical protein